jgi:UDP-glucose 4-epimerase
MNIVVTGSTGFLGRSLIKWLGNKFSKKCIFPVLRKNTTIFDEFSPIVVDDINSTADWSDKLQGIDCVIHCAARVHVMNEVDEDPLEAFREVNVRGTLQLAEAAAKSGVKRFIFISSIKVSGESTTGRLPYKSSDTVSPEDPYGISKAEAEDGLKNLATKTGMDVVIIRPPLVYGEGVKANFASLMNLVGKGLPLPFRSINGNKRSMVSVYNLVDLIITCIKEPKAANQIFLVSDDNDLSTAEMVALMAKAHGKTNLALPVPVWLFDLAAKILNKQDVVSRLTGSLQLDIEHTKKTLNWQPPYSVEHGFKLAVKK